MSARQHVASAALRPQYLTMPPLAPGFSALTEMEERFVAADPDLGGDPTLVRIAISNQQWFKAHPRWREQPKADTRAVYFISAPMSGLIKIGVAGNPQSRLRELSTMSPEPLHLIGTTTGGQPCERALHRRFEHLRSHGEWFREAPELLDFIRGVSSMSTLISSPPVDASYPQASPVGATRLGGAL